MNPLQTTGGKDEPNIPINMLTHAECLCLLKSRIHMILILGL